MLRKSSRRQAILTLLRNTTSHPTADAIYDEVRKQIPKISKGTVYRNLKVLKEAGKIREINLSGTVSRYEAAYSSHYHFRCVNCDRVIDLDGPTLDDLDSKVARQTGLKISYHHMEFCGLCHDCQSLKGKIKRSK